MSTKTIVMDLDGTICTQESSGTYHLATPKASIVALVNKLYDNGHRIVIFTARGMDTCNGDLEMIEANYFDMTEKWLLDNGVKYHKLQFGKPAAWKYIDDKACLPKDMFKDLECLLGK